MDYEMWPISFLITEKDAPEIAVKEARESARMQKG
jgi:hypothetical protein